MGHPYRPLYLSGIAVLVTALIVGVAFADVSADAVLSGTIVLAGVMSLLFLLSRRDGLDDHDEHEQQHHSMGRR